MNIETENLNRLDQIQSRLAAQAASQDPENQQDLENQQAIQDGKETLKQALYLFGEMGNEKLNAMHERMGVPQDKLSTATDLLGDAISKHLKVEYLENSVEAAAALYIGTLTVQQWRIFQEVRPEIIQKRQKEKQDKKPEINTQE